MINKPIRNHWTFIIQDIFSSFKSLFIFFILMFSVRKAAVYIGMGILIIGSVIKAIKKWKNTEFYIEENLLVYKTGFLRSTKQEIPFSKIDTIDVGKSLVDRIFNICTVKINTGNVTEKETEFNMKLKYSLAEELRETILSSKTDNESELVLLDKKDEKNLEKVISIKEIVMYAVTKGKLAWAFGGFFAVMNFADDFEKFAKTSIIKDLGESISIDSTVLQNRTKAVFMIIGLLLIMYIIINLLSIVFEIVKFYGFTIIVKNNNFSISYGLINKKEYSIPIEKIHGLKYKQGLLQQWLGIYTLETVTIGYGDEKNEKAILYPIANNKFKEEFLDKMLPEMIFSNKVEKPPKSSIKRFMLMRILIPLIILIPLYFIIEVIPSEFKLTVIAVIVLLSAIAGYLNYKNTSLGVTDTIIVTSAGGFNKTTNYIRQSSIQSIEKIQNPLQRKAMVCDYKLDIQSNNLADSVKVRHMEEELIDSLYENLIV